MNSQTMAGTNSTLPRAKGLMLSLLLMMASAFSCVTASAATLTVGLCQPGGYSTIQSAVNAAAAGDTVNVCPGVYPESVLITKNLTLAGINAKDQLGVPTITYGGKGDKPVCQPEAEAQGACPQVFVVGATAKIIGLHIDDSAFPKSTCDATPVAIFFLNAAGTVSSDTLVNQNTICDELQNGLGVLAAYTIDTGSYSLDIANNTINNFGFGAIYLDGYDLSGDGLEAVKLTGSISGNMITPVQSSTDVISLFVTSAEIVSSNKITGVGTQDDSLAIYINHSDKPSLIGNTISNIGAGVDLEDVGPGTLATNSLSNIGESGVILVCSHNNALIANTIADTPNVGAVGVFFVDCNSLPPVGSDDNLLIGNKFNGFCSGILTGSSLNVGNIYAGNSFANITPGTDIMAGDNCP
ncbi:MAG TPA: right-handed parallel beta-helix repeat-containing protein [Candidatus Binataceae bacterium]|nr:right-handed parallel beta-helix repeat-containing protein [Candidatus Binataceae bacterium]